MKKYLRFIVICAVVSALSAGLGAYAATNFGSESDPLITLSYLEQVLEPELKQAYDAQTKEAIAQLEQRLKEKDDSLFCPVTVPAGTVMHCEAGCEILVRTGDGVLAGNVLDLTTGEAAGTGLMAHHLYLAVEENATLTAAAETTLMVRGGYVLLDPMADNTEE